MEKNDWMLATKFFTLKISADMIYGPAKDFKMVFICNNIPLELPKNTKGKYDVISILSCLNGNYGEDIKDAAQEIKRHAKSQKEDFYKVEKTFVDAQIKCREDINHLRKEQNLSLI